MITGPIPDFAKEGFQYLKDEFNIKVYDFQLTGRKSIEENILCNSWKIMEKIRPDVITNIFGATSLGFPCGVMSRHWNSYNVLRVAGDEISSRLKIGTYEENSQRHLYDLALEKKGFDLAHKIITIAPWEQKRVRLSCNDSSKLKVCMRGVDLQRFENQNCNKYANEEQFKVLFVGRKSLEKGYDLVESVADHFFSQNKNIEFQFAGTFDKKLVQNKNYLGFVQSEDLPALYNSADALILVSRTEGFPQVLAEAMACGKPCIISKHLFHGYIEDGKEAFLVDLDISEIVNKVLLLANNKELYQKLSVNARKFAEQQLDKKDWQEIYRKIILGEDNFDEFNRLRFFTP